MMQTGEPLPIDNHGRDRLLRTGVLAQLLVERGHEVTWWTSDFYHHKKKYRYGKDKTLKMDNGIVLNLIHSVGYTKNVSIRRLVDHYLVSKKFKRWAERAEKPDLIVCSYPDIFMCYEAIGYGLRKKVPVVVDVRDYWPDIFIEVFPGTLKGLARFLVSPLQRKTKYIFRNAEAVTGMTEKFVEWGIRYGERIRTKRDKSFPFGYIRSPIPVGVEKEARRFWEGQGIDGQEDRLVVIFAGTIGRQFELEALIRAARRLEERRESVLFVICGTGDQFERYRKMAQGCTNIIMPGWVDRERLAALMAMGDAGIAPYRPTRDFLDSVPNKAIEYMSFGLPILSNIEGELGKLISEYQCGIVYEDNGNGSLENTIMELVKNKGKLEEMSRNASRAYKERYDGTKVYGQMIDYLEQINDDNTQAA